MTRIAFLKSLYKSGENIFVKARQTLPKDFMATLKKENGKICSNVLKEDSFIANKISFTNKDEIVCYFNSIGIKADIRDFSDVYLQTFSNIAEQIKTLQKYGISDCEIDRIILSDWRKTGEIQKIIEEAGLKKYFPPDRRAYCGANSRCVFINSSKEAQNQTNGVFKKFLHEIGHILNYNYKDANGILRTSGINSVLGKGSTGNTGFLNKQLKVLEIDDIARDIPTIFPYSISQGINVKNCNFQILPLTKGYYKIDKTKMIEYMNSKCKCYNKVHVGEQVAEIFEDLLRGRNFDDLTMLMYDFNGGARIPNLIIKGQKYDDYIKSLYANKELTNKLKQYVSLTPI